MEVKERVIDLREYFLYLFEKKIIIIIVCLLFAGSLACFSYVKQSKSIKGTLSLNENEEELAGLGDIISQNHDAYYHLNGVTAFTDADQPEGTYNASVRLFVDFDFSCIEGNANLDFSQMISKLQQDSLIVLVSDESMKNVVESLQLNDYEDMENFTAEDLSWLINKNFLGANVLQIVVSDVDENRAQDIIDAVVEEFIKKSEQIDTIDSVTVIDDAKNVRKGIADIEKENLQDDKNGIEKKTLAKYGIVGLIGGLVIILSIYLLVFIFRDAVRNAVDIAFANVSLFGIVSNSEKKKEEDYKRIAYNLEFAKAYENVCFIPVDANSENEDFISGVKNALSEVKSTITIYSTKNIIDSAEAIMNASESDVVILLVTRGKTRMSDLIFAKEEMDKIGKKVLGAVIEQ